MTHGRRYGKKEDRSATRTVLAISNIDWENSLFSFIPYPWYHHRLLQGSRGRPNLVALAVLAYIVYWYRPKELHDNDGKLIGYERKFRAEVAQISYDQIADTLNLGKDQARDAVQFLERQGLIRKEFRTVRQGNLVFSNVLFIEPIANKIKKITEYERPERAPVSRAGDTVPATTPIPSRADSTESVAAEPDTYTKNSNKDSQRQVLRASGAQGAPPSHRPEGLTRPQGSNLDGIALRAQQGTSQCTSLNSTNPVPPPGTTSPGVLGRTEAGGDRLRRSRPYDIRPLPDALARIPDAVDAYGQIQKLYLDGRVGMDLNLLNQVLNEHFRDPDVHRAAEALRSISDDLQNS